MSGEPLLKAHTAACAALDAFACVLAHERERGHVTEELESAWFADLHDKLNSAAYWHAGTNGSNKEKRQPCGPAQMTGRDPEMNPESATPVGEVNIA